MTPQDTMRLALEALEMLLAWNEKQRKKCAR